MYAGRSTLNCLTLRTAHGRQKYEVPALSFLPASSGRMRSWERVAAHAWLAYPKVALGANAVLVANTPELELGTNNRELELNETTSVNTAGIDTSSARLLMPRPLNLAAFTCAYGGPRRFKDAYTSGATPQTNNIGVPASFIYAFLCSSFSSGLAVVFAHCSVSVSHSVGNCFCMCAKHVLIHVASSCNASELVLARRCFWCPCAGHALVYPHLAITPRWTRGISRKHLIPICMQFHALSQRCFCLRRRY